MAGNNIINQLMSRLVSSVQMQINSVSKFVMKMQSYSNVLAQKAQNKITEFMKTLTKRPKSKKDYWKFLGMYFSKRFVITGLFGVVGVLYLYFNLFHPMLEGKLWYAKIILNTQKYGTITGKAKIYDTDHVLIYQGNVITGKANGYGVQYRRDGTLIYKGDFILDKYKGNGELYDESEKMIYKGGFESNKYQGEGRKINSLGVTTFIGNFDVGMRSGKGVEYDPQSGLRIYYGEYNNDVRSGRGVVYDTDGESVVYEGNFSNNLYHGEGKKFVNNHLIYTGNFENGDYSGKGILYDEKSGIIKYVGEFSEGLYNGSGKMYDPLTMKLIYDGDFKTGKRHGTGVAYDALGTPIYSGKYRDDGIDFISILGLGLEDVENSFGTSKMQKTIGDNSIKLYKSIGAAMIFNENSEGDNKLEKVIINAAFEFMGINSKSTTADVHQRFGASYSSIQTNVTESYALAYSLLGINMKITDENIMTVDKYIFGNYYIKITYDNASKVNSLEIGSTVDSTKS
ncbi:MAG: hypothetical protein NkDv07_0061 [Candidatus Improbicoccus devescovinae]|nr:MAG: hypothetical protein NkDv07_0061 [Candidatus Improbicoccus devescovinae]